MKILKKDIKDKNFKKFYLFYGEEEYLKRYYENEMKTKVVTNMKEFNIDVFDGKELITTVLEDCINTAPFMSEYLLIIIKNSDLFAGTKKAEEEKLIYYMDNMSGHNVILFVENKVDKRNKLYKKVVKEGYSIDFKTPEQNELIKWCINVTKKNDSDISSKNASFLINMVDKGMESINNELQKLISVKNKGEEITKLDIISICTKSLELKVFDMIDAIIDSNVEKALDIFNNLILFKESPIMVLSLLARQFRLILQCKMLNSKKYNKYDIAKELGITNFLVNICLSKNHKFDEKQLIEALRDCFETDTNIKIGKLNDKIGVEMLIVRQSRS